ncbi:MAG: hypothetical protein J2O47_00880, partial [Acidimicrobiaceae bacterium]|nr:hypothetical protein [Acidimicrobiaceae bacterium]
AGCGAVVATMRGSAQSGLVSLRSGTGVIDFSPALAVADAVLYEGYLLYPYRRSSGKNRVRWQFGVLGPRAWIEAHTSDHDDGVAGSSESWWNQTECLLEADSDATIEVVLRFLQPEPPSLDPTASGPIEETATLESAVAREIHLTLTIAEGAGEGVTVTFEVPRIATAFDRGEPDACSREPAVRGTMRARAERIAARSPLYKLSVRVENTTLTAGEVSRPEALCRSLVATHVLLGVLEGTFLSLLDPPEWASGAAAVCRNVRTFPVLTGPPGSSRLLLSSPIILYDHPEVAPESPGDLFDATEIDEILSLRTLTLTAEEKAEARATDPRAAEVVDRVESMPTEVLARLHGAVRSLRRVQDPPRAAENQDPLAVPTGDLVSGSQSGQTKADAIAIGGVWVGEGSRVRLHPRGHGTDVQDMFLDGRTATVAGLLTDVDGSRYLAVTVDDDPRTTLGAGPGRLRHFSPEEVEPLGRTAESKP